MLSYSVSYLLKSVVLVMPGKGKHVNSTAKTKHFYIYSYFERQSQKSKGRGPPKLTRRTKNVTGYSEKIVLRIVAEKKSLEGTAFGSRAKRYKVERKKIIVDDGHGGIQRTGDDFYREKKFPTLEPLLIVV